MVTSYDHLIILSVRFRHSFRRLNMVPTTLYHLYATRKWCARPPRKVLEVANAVLGGASIKDASKDAEVTRDDYTSWEGWQRLVRYHVAKLRSAEAAEAEAGTTKHYAKAAEQAAKAAQLASAAAAEASSSQRPNRRAHGDPGRHAASAGHGGRRRQRQARHGGRGG
jgi:hypothetical protein